MKRGIFLFLTFISVTVLRNSIYGQCTNADFENGTFSGWTGTYSAGQCNGGYSLGYCTGCSVTNPLNKAGFNQGPNNSLVNDATTEYSQVITTTAGGNDPNIAGIGGTLPMVWPGSGSYSARIGSMWQDVSSDNTGDGETISYSFTVTPSNASFTYHYAVVLNDGGHPAGQQPYFNINMTDGAGNSIACAAYEVDATTAKTIGGFTIDAAKKIYWKPWSSVFIPLTNYMGQTVKITFTNRGCLPNGCSGIHYSYAYVDAECGPMTLAASSASICTGQQVTLTAPTGAATYSWTGPGIISGASSQVVTINQPGQYTVNMTTFGNTPCSFSMDTVIVPSPITATATPTAVSCYSDSNGAINLNVSGGTSPYAFNWAGGITTRNRIDLLAGTYNVTVTDSNSCSATAAAIITQPAAALSAVPGAGNVSCFGGSTGSITLTVTGGTTPYSFHWNSGTTTQNRTNLTSGVYDVTVTDANACSTTATATITQPAAALSAAATTSQVNCFGGNNGSINLSVLGGTTPYSFNWNGGVTTQNRTNLPAGVYDVTVTDANLCPATASATVTQPAAALNATPTTANVSCFSGSNGSITLSITGGTTPYSFNWNGGITTQNRTNLTSGVYDVIVTDANLCSISASINITQPVTALNALATPSAVSCFAGNNGSITLSVTGGTTPYSFNWNGGATTQNRTNLTSGVYDVTVTDANACSTTASATVTQPAAALSAVPSANKVSCFGGNNGSITLSITGGTIPYSFNWTGGIATQNRTNLTAGVYDVTVTDANSCSVAAFITITQPVKALNPAPGASGVNCFGGNNGSITLSVTGGTLPYSYNWNGGITTENRTNLSAGVYDVTVTDANSCSVTASAAITQPAGALNAATTPGAVSCFGGNNGSIILNVSGGTTPYSFNWNAGDTAQNRTNLTAGTYDVTVTDANLCSVVTSINILQPAAALNAVPNASAVSCFGGNNGSIILNVTGGTVPYLFYWGDGVITRNRTSLSAGVYDVTVTDLNLCSVTASANIAQPAGALNAVPTASEVSCFSGNNGSVILSVTGGTTPYSFSWNGGITTQNITNIASGVYDVTITDAKLCSVTASINISQPAAALSAAATPGAVSCFNGNNGSITLSVTGGTTPYSFNWNGGETTQNRTNLTAGIYDVTITDANLCSATASANITQPSAPLNTITSASPVNCFGGNNASITQNVAGGTTPYFFDWSDGATTQDRTGLSGGTYNVTITDANMCTMSAAVVITQPSAALTAIPITSNVGCFGDNNGQISLAVSGGTAPYSFNWGGGVTTQNRINISAGAYEVTVTDANLCSATASTVIGQPVAVLSVSPAVIPVSCFNGTNGAINLDVSGGTPPYAFNWDKGIQTQNRYGLNSGTYNVTVTDANLCKAMASATVAQPTALTLSTSASPVSCFSGNNGYVYVQVNGGIPPYTFEWNNGAQTENLNNLTSGSYTLTITDANLCSLSNTSNVPQPGAPITVLAAVSGVSCHSGNNGAITLSVNGGTAPYSFRWDSGYTGQNRINLKAGTYNVTVSDANLCSAANSATIAQPSGALNVSASVADVNCYNGNNGSVSIQVNGGTQPYSFNWNGGGHSQNLSDLPAGTYYLTVTDANLCSAVNSSTVAQPSEALTVATAPTMVSCFNGSNGSITANATGGTSPYSFNWGYGNTSQNRINLAAGTYTLTVTDINWCSTTASDVITQPSTPLTPAASAKMVSCFNEANGDIVLNVSGGTAPYFYNWGGGITTQNRNNLSSGIYIVTITDFNLCSATATAAITQPAQSLSAGTSTTPVSCFGGANGTIHLSVTGGTAPYTFNWNGNVTTQNRSNVSAGIFTVTITDANLCSVTALADVTQPSGVLNTVTNAAPVNCFGGATGAIYLIVSGGTAPYAYNWGGGITSQNRSNLPAGTYHVTVTDANLCSTTGAANVLQPSSALNSATHVSGVSCYGGNNGEIIVMVSGGTAPYTYNWNGGIQTQDRTNLNAGVYSLTVTDANACSTTNSANVPQPPSPLITIATPGNVTCYNGHNGTITLSTSGGTAPYAYHWQGNITTQNRTDLATGTYSVTVSDANLCSASASIAITQPANALAIITTAEPVTCYGGNNGSITLNVSGDNPPYTFNWGKGITTENRTNLGAGSYNVTVTDANLCSAAVGAIVAQPSAALTLNVSPEEVRCYGGSNGFVTVNASGGTPPYQYYWNGGTTGQSLVNLPTGSYEVTVTDANSCTTTALAAIVQPSPLDVSIRSTEYSCYGENNGTATGNAIGGTSPYQLLWSNGSGAGEAKQLAPGNYSLTVTDAHGCTDTASVAITALPKLDLSIKADGLPCEIAEGTIYLNVNDGAAPYSYSWSDGAKTQNLHGIHPGDYSVTVEDANGCTADTSVDVKNLNSFTVSAWGGGTITIGQSIELFSTSSDSANTSFSWSPPANLSCPQCAITNAEPLESTTYTVIGTDTDGCVAQDTVSITVIDNHNIFIPNAFTPNGDGNNDYFSIYGNLEGIEYIDAMVFNRWGEKVFEANEPNFKWDGTYKGVLQDPNVFVYVIKTVFLDGSNRLYKGSVTLIR